MGIFNLETSLIFSSKSFLPRSATANLTVYFYGRAHNLLEVSVICIWGYIWENYWENDLEWLHLLSQRRWTFTWKMLNRLWRTSFVARLQMLMKILPLKTQNVSMRGRRGGQEEELMVTIGKEKKCVPPALTVISARLKPWWVSNGAGLEPNFICVWPNNKDQKCNISFSNSFKLLTFSAFCLLFLKH